MCDPNIISHSAINKFKLLKTTSCAGIHKKSPCGDFGIDQRMGALVNKSQRAIAVPTLRGPVIVIGVLQGCSSNGDTSPHRWWGSTYQNTGCNRNFVSLSEYSDRFEEEFGILLFFCFHFFTSSDYVFYIPLQHTMYACSSFLLWLFIFFILLPLVGNFGKACSSLHDNGWRSALALATCDFHV